MFNQADQTYRRVPARMPVETAKTALARVREHLEEDAADRTFHVTLHGGEPTLWPLESFVDFFDAIYRLRSDGFRITVSLQTNGYAIRPQLLDLLAEHGVTLGISVDGPREINDAFRVTHRGTGSYDRVMRAVEAIITRGHEDIIGGFLSVARPEIAPSEYLDWANNLPVRRLDVLWPIEFHYANVPWRELGERAYWERPRYGTWFASLFEEWWRRDDPSLEIRFFYDCIGVLLGSKRHVDDIVNDVLDMFVVNTDGEIEYSDYFRAAKDGGSRAMRSISNTRLSDLSDDIVFRYCLDMRSHLPRECGRCPHADICGGGFLPGRMEPERKLPRRRSVLCPDHYYFFNVLKRHVERTEYGDEREGARPPLIGAEPLNREIVAV